jgi:hypothetical protein
MTVLNFTHPLTDTQQLRLEELAGRAARVVEVPTQLDNTKAFVEQVETLLAGVPLSAEGWQTEPLALVLPGHSAIAAVVLAAVHGRCGYFPAIVRLRPVAGATVPQFEVAELIPLQSVREAQRKERMP